jgi:hypothetical protein
VVLQEGFRAFGGFGMGFERFRRLDGLDLVLVGLVEVLEMDRIWYLMLEMRWRLEP